MQVWLSNMGDSQKPTMPRLSVPGAAKGAATASSSSGFLRPSPKPARLSRSPLHSDNEAGEEEEYTMGSFAAANRAAARRNEYRQAKAAADAAAGAKEDEPKPKEKKERKITPFEVEPQGRVRYQAGFGAGDKLGSLQEKTRRAPPKKK